MSGSPEGGGPAPPGAGAATFDADLRLLRRRVVRRWALAVAARCGIAALAVALVPALLAALGAIGWAWAIVVPAALFLVALGARLSRPPSTAQVARLLDDRLGLFDVTVTALELERAGEPVDEGPAAPVFAEAAALLRAGASAWRPRARLGARELAAAGALILALAAIVGVGTAGGGGGSTKVTASSLPPGLRHHAAGGPSNVSPPLVPPRARRKGANGAADPGNRHPYGIYDYGFEGKHQLPHFDSKDEHEGVRYAGGRPPGSQQPPSQLSAPSVAEGNEAREKAEEEAAGGGAKPGSNAEREHSEEGPPNQSLKSLSGGAVPPSGSVSPVPNANSAAPPSSSQSASGPSSAPGSRSATGAPGRESGGSSGTQGAGDQRAGLAGGEKGREGGGTSGELVLKAGFAAVKSGKAATARGPRNAQGAGGPGKSAGIGGSAFEEAEAGSLGYVPPDAGIAPTLDPGLFARYLDALAAIAGRRW